MKLHLSETDLNVVGDVGKVDADSLGHAHIVVQCQILVIRSSCECYISVKQTVKRCAKAMHARKRTCEDQQHADLHKQ